MEGVLLAQRRGSEIICNHYTYSGGHAASRLLSANDFPDLGETALLKAWSLSGN